MASSQYNPTFSFSIIHTLTLCWQGRQSSTRPTHTSTMTISPSPYAFIPLLQEILRFHQTFYAAAANTDQEPPPTNAADPTILVVEAARLANRFRTEGNTFVMLLQQPSCILANMSMIGAIRHANEFVRTYQRYLDWTSGLKYDDCCELRLWKRWCVFMSAVLVLITGC